VERLEPKPVPIKAKPATGSHRNWSGRESGRGEGAASEAVVVPVLMVSVDVAFPLGSKVTEFGLSEQAGADCSGCTEQVSVTGLSNAFRRFRVAVEVALCPRLTVPGVGVDAEMEKSVPAVFSSTLMVLLSEFVTTKSGTLSWLRSAAIGLPGLEPAAKLEGA